MFGRLFRSFKPSTVGTPARGLSCSLVTTGRTIQLSVINHSKRAIFTKMITPLSSVSCNSKLHEQEAIAKIVEKTLRLYPPTSCSVSFTYGNLVLTRKLEKEFTTFSCCYTTKGNKIIRVSEKIVDGKSVEFLELDDSAGRSNILGKGV